MGRCELGDYLHTSTDKQEVRNRIFDVIVNCGISVQATIMEKRKAKPAIRESLVRFYTYGWRDHFFNGMQKIVTPYSELHVTAASIGIKRERTIFKKAVASIMSQAIVGKVWAADVFPSGTDPCCKSLTTVRGLFRGNGSGATLDHTTLSKNISRMNPIYGRTIRSTLSKGRFIGWVVGPSC